MLVKLIPWNRFLGLLKVLNFGFSFHPNYKGKGVGIEMFLLLVEHTCLYLPDNMFFMSLSKGEYEEGGGKGWELTLCMEPRQLR